MGTGVAFFGGTFNPIHYGHVALARNAIKELNLEKVLFVPSWHPPHKKHGWVDDLHRIAMCQLAVKNETDFAVSTVELDNNISYTAETLKLLHDQYSDTMWSLLMGEDAFLSLPYWKSSDTIYSIAQIVVSHRAAGTSQFEDTCVMLKHQGAKVVVLPETPAPISSSKIRMLLENGQTVEDLVPPLVYQYIQEHHLYEI